MLYDAQRSENLPRLDKALFTAAKLVARYEATLYEADAVAVFERIEQMKVLKNSLSKAKERANLVLSDGSLKNL